jgi:hypothetical protein
MKSIYAVVHGVLARHLSCDESALRPWQELDRHLDLTPLELALIAVEIEELADVQLALEEIGPSATVGDLLRLAVRARTASSERASGSFLRTREDLVRQVARRRRCS